MARSASVPSLLIQEWEGINQLGRWHESNQESVTVPFVTRQNFTLSSGPSATIPNYAIGIKVFWSSALDPGPLFRSGHFWSTLPTPKPPDPNGNIDIIEGPLHTITEADIATGLPTLPISVDALSTITGLPIPTITPAAASKPGTVDFVATGMTQGVPGKITLPSPVAFTVAAPMTITPSVAMDATGPPTEVVVVDLDQQATTISFTGVSEISSDVEALILNALIGVFKPKILASASAVLTKVLSAKAIAAVAGLVGGGSGTPPTMLPPGVVLSATRVTIGTLGSPPVTGIHVIPALGMFGPLVKTLFPSSGGGTGAGGACPLHVLATQAGSSRSIRLQTFRTFRDRVLLSQEPGTRLVELYYRHAGEMANLMASEARHSERATSALARLQADLERGEPPSPPSVAALRGLLIGLLPECSDELRTDLRAIIAPM